MGNRSPIFGAEYLGQKRQELIRLRDELIGAATIAQAEETQIKASSGVTAPEGDAQCQESLEKAGKLVERHIERINCVERALKKIEEGTYGLSDISDARIPDEVLTATPETICTVAEQGWIDRRR